MPMSSNNNDSLTSNHKAPKLQDDMAKNEWDKIASTAKINDVHSVPMSVFEQRPRTRELNIQDLSEEDLESLKTTDPFLYFAIPGVRAAKISLKDVNHSDVINALGRCHGTIDDSSTSQARSRQPAARHCTRVLRSSCVSFECHASILLEDMLDELNLDNSDNDVGADE